jgi:hypothetical protein
MFARFHQTPSRLQVSLRESRRVGGKPRCEHIASLGAVPISASLPDRVEFWRQLGGRFSKLSNLIGADRGKLIASIHARIPKVTDDDIRIVHRENADADKRIWSGLQDVNAEMAEGNKALAAEASSPRKIRQVESFAQDQSRPPIAALPKLFRR